MDQITHEVRLQQWKEIIQARLTAFNANTFGRKSEQMEYDGQESLFNEVEAACEEIVEEPEFEDITYKRKKQAGNGVW